MSWSTENLIELYNWLCRLYTFNFDKKDFARWARNYLGEDVSIDYTLKIFIDNELIEEPYRNKLRMKKCGELDDNDIEIQIIATVLSP